VETELPQLLERADLLKFARGNAAEREAREAGVQLRAIVDHVEARLNPESDAAKRQSAAKARAA
jgi:ElaB/YqjD/DUF883 family membrane-anchored ribosome-binding protein